MWDRPELMNAVSTALLSLAGLLALYACVVMAVNLPLFPVREVRISGTLSHVTRAQIEAIVRGELRGNFFTLDLIATRAAFGKLPWVRAAQTRRQWPGRLQVTLEEHVPLARWGEAALVNTHGEVFEAAYDGRLPTFAGPAGTAKEIAIQFAYFRNTLAPIGQTPHRVQISARRAWQIRLDSGLTLEIGRENVEARLARFVAAYERTIGGMRRRIDYVDLRYANGFAVRVPELSRPEPKKRG